MIYESTVTVVAVLLAIYRGVVLDITLCGDGRTPCAHRETPYGGFPTKKQSTGLFLNYPSCVSLRWGFRSLRRDGGISFVIVVLLFAAAHRVSSVVSASSVSIKGF